MLYLGCDSYEGRAARIYRSPDMIRRDMRDIRNRIGDLSESLNFRGMIDSLLCEVASGDFDGFIIELDSLLSEAREAVDGLEGLNGTLIQLADELDEARRAVR